MDRNLMKHPEIVELSDHPEIQGKWKPERGDFYVLRRDKTHQLHILDFYKWREFVALSTEHLNGIYIWLPIGFNIKTGDHQVNELILEAHDVMEACEVYTNQNATFISMFRGWMDVHQELIDKNYSEIVLKLMMLNHAIVDAKEKVE